MMLILLVATIGMNVRVHYCMGELASVYVNGMDASAIFGLEETESLCAHQDNPETCPHCKNLKNYYKVQSQFAMGQTISISPQLAVADWFHGALANLSATVLPEVPVTDVEVAGYHYVRPPLLRVSLPQGGLRAPPVYYA